MSGFFILCNDINAHNDPLYVLMELYQNLKQGTPIKYP